MKGWIMGTKLREIQLCELEILKEVVRICEKHDIDYWLAYGTMLGAVRHEGFIPWDDDLDIYMRREDFKKFEKICKTELSGDYFLQTQRSDPCIGNLFYKVRKNGTYMPEDGLREFGKKIHEGIWIDIFPIISASDDIRHRDMQITLLQKLQLMRFYHNDISKKRIRSYIRELVISLYEYYLWKRVLALGDKNSESVMAISNCFYPHQEKQLPKTILKRNYFNSYAEYRFEDDIFHGIEQYDEYLSHEYDEDYMVPKHFNQHVMDYSRVTL